MSECGVAATFFPQLSGEDRLLLFVRKDAKSFETLLFESAVAALIYQEKVTDAMKTD